jgi:hypothetical protein
MNWLALSLSLCPVRKSAGTRTESVFHLCLFDAGTETAGEEGEGGGNAAGRRSLPRPVT